MFERRARAGILSNGLFGGWFPFQMGVCPWILKWVAAWSRLRPVHALLPDELTHTKSVKKGPWQATPTPVQLRPKIPRLLAHSLSHSSPFNKGPQIRWNRTNASL